MNDERLVEMLGSLGHERMDRAADARARQRLENEWADIQDRRGTSWLRALAPALIAIGFVAIAAFATLRAPGDSPLYGARIAIEDAAANAYADPQARVQYLLGLYEQRQAEAARLETIGSAASSGARRIEQRTLASLQALLPLAPEEEVPPAASPSPPVPIATPSSAPASASPTPRPTATPSPVTAAATARPTPVATLTPLRTEPPRPTPTPTPKPTPTPTKSDTVPVVLNGTVVDATGAPAGEVCISVAATDCQTRTTSAGIYRLTVNARIGQTVYVYAWVSDATGKITYKGTASAVVRGSTVQVPTIALHPY
jgi:hypothetical protein